MKKKKTGKKPVLRSIWESEEKRYVGRIRRREETRKEEEIFDENEETETKRIERKGIKRRKKKVKKNVPYEKERLNPIELEFTVETTRKHPTAMCVIDILTTMMEGGKSITENFTLFLFKSLECNTFRQEEQVRGTGCIKKERRNALREEKKKKRREVRR